MAIAWNAPFPEQDILAINVVMKSWYCAPHQPLARQGPQEDEMRKHRNHHPKSAGLLRYGNGTAEQGAIIRSKHVCADCQWKEFGARWATERQ